MTATFFVPVYIVVLYVIGVVLFSIFAFGYLLDLVYRWRGSLKKTRPNLFN